MGWKGLGLLIPGADNRQKWFNTRGAYTLSVTEDGPERYSWAVRREDGSVNASGVSVSYAIACSEAWRHGE